MTRTTLRASLAAGAILASGVSAQAQGFGNAYFFGDSLTDCCVSGRFTTGNAPNWADQLPPAIGARYTASALSNAAVGGAQSGFVNAAASILPANLAQSGLLSQIAGFVARNPAIGARDIAGIWIGTNDIWPSTQTISTFVQPIGARPSATALTDFIAGNVRSSVNSLVAQGFRNIVLVSPYDMAKSEVYSALGTDSPDTRALATRYSEAYRDRLATMYTPGVNTYFLDTVTLLRRVQANPALYGFDHVTAVDSCAANPSCATASVATQNRYVFADFIHTGSGFDQVMANYIANTINARSSLPAQGDLAQAAGQTFSGVLMNRLDASRRFPVAGTGPYNFYAAITKAPPGAVQIAPGSAWSIFAEGSYAGLNRNARMTPTGPDNPSIGADYAGATAGVKYRASPSLLVGAAFNYLNTGVDAIGATRASINVDSYQGGVFASYTSSSFFADGVLTYGLNNYGIRRLGVIDSLTSSPDGNTLTLAAKVGYLYDLNTVRVGPIAELS